MKVLDKSEVKTEAIEVHVDPNEFNYEQRIVDEPKEDPLSGESRISSAGPSHSIFGIISIKIGYLESSQLDIWLSMGEV